MTNKKLNLKDILLCSMYTAMLCLGAFIKIPVFLVPFTLQFMFSNLSCLISGKKISVLSAVLYVVIGLIGVPVFSQGGGIGYLFNQNFGFILGFIAGNFFGGLALEKIKIEGFFKYLISSLINLISVYTSGVLYFFVISKFYLNDITLVKSGISALVFFCLPGDMLSLIFTCIIARRIKIIVNKY